MSVSALGAGREVAGSGKPRHKKGVLGRHRRDQGRGIGGIPSGSETLASETGPEKELIIRGEIQIGKYDLRVYRKGQKGGKNEKKTKLL